MIRLAMCLVFLHDVVKPDPQTIIAGSFFMGSLPDRGTAAAEGPRGKRSRQTDRRAKTSRVWT